MTKQPEPEKTGWQPNIFESIPDPALLQELTLIMHLQRRARDLAKKIREKRIKDREAFPEKDQPDKDANEIEYASKMYDPDEIEELDGALGKLLTDFSDNDKIVLTRILEITSPCGLKVLEVLEEKIEVTKKGGSVKVTKKENPLRNSPFGIFKSASKVTGYAEANFDSYRREATDTMDTDKTGSLTMRQVNEVRNATILWAVQQFREKIERTLELFGFYNH